MSGGAIYPPASGHGRADGHGHDHGASAHRHDRHDHSHGGVDPALLRSREAMRALWLSLTILGATAIFQIVIVILSGSVALLADSVHNVGDALTAIPLAVAFALLRRPRTARLPYGWGRAEDFAGLAVVAVILFSAIYAAYEAFQRLMEPTPPSYLFATAVAGVVGFVGNEWVAVYRIRSGKRIGSAALVADGYHARIDGFTSLAVVVGVMGVALGFELADPIVGLLISAAIMRIVWQSTGTIGLRALDGIEEHTIDEIRASTASVPGVQAVRDVRARWIGHVVRAEVVIAVEASLTLQTAHDIAARVRGTVVDSVEHVTEVAIETVPSGAPSR
jgi:cation diffusion facilitator family transporter